MVTAEKKHILTTKGTIRILQRLPFFPQQCKHSTQNSCFVTKKHFQTHSRNTKNILYIVRIEALASWRVCRCPLVMEGPKDSTTTEHCLFVLPNELLHCLLAIHIREWVCHFLRRFCRFTFWRRCAAIIVVLIYHDVANGQVKVLVEGTRSIHDLFNLTKFLFTLPGKAGGHHVGTYVFAVQFAHIYIYIYLFVSIFISISIYSSFNFFIFSFTYHVFVVDLNRLRGMNIKSIYIYYMKNKLACMQVFGCISQKNAKRYACSLKAQIITLIESVETWHTIWAFYIHIQVCK